MSGTDVGVTQQLLANAAAPELEGFFEVPKDIQAFQALSMAVDPPHDLHNLRNAFSELFSFSASCFDLSNVKSTTSALYSPLFQS